MRIYLAEIGEIELFLKILMLNIKNYVNKPLNAT